MLRRLCLLSLLSLVWLTGCPQQSEVSSPEISADSDRITIFYTNDLHSRFRGTGPTRMFTPRSGDGDPVLGHYARLASILRNRRHQKEDAGIPTLTLDAGDFYSGSVFATLAPNRRNPHVPELEFFQMLDYDAVALGNHEFDAGLQGLSTMLEKAISKGISVPILSNVMKNQKSDAARAFVGRFLDADPRIIRRSIIKLLGSEDGGLKIGIIGAMGLDALNGCLVRRNGLEFHGYDDEDNDTSDPEYLLNYLEGEVAKLRDETDFIILVFHGAGTTQRQGSLEEVRAIADQIPEINLIVAGHTHDAYEKPRKINRTHIVQAGEYGMFLGEIDLILGDDEVLEVENRLHSIDDQLEADPEVLSAIDRWLRHLKEDSHEDFDRPVAKVNEPLLHRSHELASSLADGLFLGALDAARKNHIAEPEAYVMLDGYVREGFPAAAAYSYADISRIFDSGLDKDLKEGSAVVIVCAEAGMFKALWLGGVRTTQPGREYSDWNIRMGGRQDAWTTPFGRIPIAINQALANSFQLRLPAALSFNDCETGLAIREDGPESLDAYRLKDSTSGRVLKEQDLFIRSFPTSQRDPAEG